MDAIRSKKLVLKLRVDELAIAEKNWILSHIKAQIRHLSLTESMKLANRIQHKAVIEVFKLYPGGGNKCRICCRTHGTKSKDFGKSHSGRSTESEHRQSRKKCPLPTR